MAVEIDFNQGDRVPKMALYFSRGRVSDRGVCDMHEKLISRRGAFSFLGITAALALAVPTAVLTTSDAEAQAQPSPAAPAPAAQAPSGMTRGEQRRTARRAGRQTRRQARRTARQTRRQGRRGVTPTKQQ